MKVRLARRASGAGSCLSCYACRTDESGSRLRRIRIGLGLLAVAAGTAWLYGGVAAVQAGALAVAAAIPVLLLIAGAVLVFRASTPRGTLAGPLALLAIGGGGVAAQYGVLRAANLDRLVGLGLVVGGIAVAMSSRSEEPSAPVSVRRFRTLVWPRRTTVRGPAPFQLVVQAALGRVAVDLSHADFPKGVRSTEIDMSIFYGRIELALPATWTVVAGRVAAARGVAFEGLLDSRKPAELDEDQEESSPTPRVVLNALGLGGAISVCRSPAPGPRS